MSASANQTMFDGEMAELLEGFIVETNEIFEKLDQDLTELEKRPLDSALHNTIFRAVHTVKGTSSFLGFQQLTELAHHFEDVLNKVRRGELTVTSDSMDVMFGAFDLMKTLIQRIEAKNAERIDLAEILIRLKAVAQQSQAPVASNNSTKNIPSSPAPLSHVGSIEPQSISVPQKQEVPAAFDPEMAELLESFVVETVEVLDKLGRDLFALETRPVDAELHNAIFRAVHTVKGTSGFLGFSQLTDLAHRFEDVLSKVRRREVDVTPMTMEVMFATYDMMKLLLRNIEGKSLENVDLSKHLADLKVVLQGGIVESSMNREESVHEPRRQAEAKGEPQKQQAGTESGAPTQGTSQHSKAAESTIRVDVTRLDSLMNLVGELVLARNQLAQVAQQISEEDEGARVTRTLNDASSQIDFITTELQMAVMRTRMVPIGKVFNKLPRLIRDLSKETGKDIELQIFGEETDLDKTVVEELNDPLVHLLRNAADHGIELPDARIMAGKTARGTVIVNAEHQGNNIVITIQDDGKGMDPEVLKRKAIEKGMLSEAQAREMSKSEAFNLVFAPGFSTAAKVTNVSGRGVGMDVVRTNISKLKGIIEIESEIGVGTKIILKLPLTLAIIQGLIAQVGNDVYAIPLESVLEVVRTQQDEIATINGHEVLRMRDSIVPLARIAEVFEVPSNGHKSDGMYVVVVGVAERRLGLIVDLLMGQKEIVVKSLGEYLGDVPGVAGSTILGDGRAIVIIDVAQFMKLSADHVHQCVV